MRVYIQHGRLPCMRLFFYSPLRRSRQKAKLRRGDQVEGVVQQRKKQQRNSLVPDVGKCTILRRQRPARLM